MTLTQILGAVIGAVAIAGLVIAEKWAKNRSEKGGKDND